MFDALVARGVVHKGARLPSLTGMRFIAAVLVFFHHVIWLNVFSDPGTAEVYRKYFINAGHVGVSFFFVLSGFILTVSARDNDGLGRFYRRRFFKIYPNHLVTFFLALFVIAGAGSTGLLANLFLVQAWVPDYGVIFSVDPPSWSLSCEVLFYLAFPFLLRLIRKIDPDHLWYWVGGVLVAIVGVAVVVGAVVPGTPIMPDGQPVSMTQFWLVYVLPPVRALDFLLGMLIGLLVLNGKWVGLRLAPAAVLFVVVYVLSPEVPYLFGLNAVTIVPIALLVPAAALADVNGQKSWLRGRTAVFLGEVSFAFYLVHVLVMIGARPLFGATSLFSGPVAFLVIVANLIATVAAAWLLYTVVEKPAMRLFSSPRKQAITPVPALQGEK
ncbi:acyltransferase family protein [Lentzea sp. NPDC051213]|uniref:acyltransferase family protein n=1 Tax=Lentzea sp. NPDC051213 TaxID=3364126 RepID=UPI003791E194